MKSGALMLRVLSAGPCPGKNLAIARLLAHDRVRGKQLHNVQMKELAGLRVGPKTRAAEALGAEIAEDERQRVEPLPASTLGTDGIGTPVRPSEREGRTGKQPDGSNA